MNLLTLATVFAQDTSLNLSPNGVGNPTTFTIEGMIAWAVTLVIAIAGLIFFFMLIIGGLRWVLSGGDKAQTESARAQITAALIGLVIIFSAWAIATLVERVFGVSILNAVIPEITQDAGE